MTPAFAACALGRTLTVSFACRAEHRVMNGCMKAHATAVEHDAAREEWFAMRLERQRQRERKSRVAAAQEDFMREWWGAARGCTTITTARDGEARGADWRVDCQRPRDAGRGELEMTGLVLIVTGLHFMALGLGVDYSATAVLDTPENLPCMYDILPERG